MKPLAKAIQSSPLMAQWHALKPRQQMALGALAAVLAAVLIFTQLVEPLLEAKVEARAELAYHQTTLNQIERARPIIERLQARSEPSTIKTNQSLLSVTDETARAAGLAGALSRMEPNGERTVNVWLDGAEFEVVMDWLSDLSVTQGVEVERLSVNRSEQADRVDVRVSLMRGG